MPIRQSPPEGGKPRLGEASGQLSLESVYWKFGRYVGWFATRLLGDPADVDDLVQEVFEIAARNLHTVRDPERVRPWLATITVRQARWRLRQRRLRSFLGLGGDTAAALETLIAPHAGQESVLLLHEVFGLLDGLSSKHRVAWLLRHVEGEKLEDAAEIAGCSLSEFKRRLSKAESLMAKVIGNE